MSYRTGWYRFNCQVGNPLGLHMRPAGQISAFAKSWPGIVELDHERETYDVKSVNSLLEACLVYESRVEVYIEPVSGRESGPFALKLRGLIEALDDG